MGAICRKSDGKTVYLPHQLVVGRSPSSDLPLAVSSVSFNQAVLRWDGSRWIVGDLGSRNGTYVNGQRVGPTSRSTLGLRAGDELAFAERDEIWIVLDDSAPQALLIPDDGGNPVALVEGRVNVWPAEANPLAYFFYERAAWRFEDLAGHSQELGHGHAITVDGQGFRLHLPGPAAETPPAANPIAELTIERAELEIEVAPDEESAGATAVVAGDSFALPRRTHLYLLAYLARERLKGRETPESSDSFEDGWVAVDEACRQLNLAPEALAVMVYRCRQDLERIGFREASRVVDRGKRGFLRIGVPADRLRVTSG